MVTVSLAGRREQGGSGRAKGGICYFSFCVEEDLFPLNKQMRPRGQDSPLKPLRGNPRSGHPVGPGCHVSSSPRVPALNSLHPLLCRRSGRSGQRNRAATAQSSFPSWGQPLLNVAQGSWGGVVGGGSPLLLEKLGGRVSGEKMCRDS